jgi:hypothetical protein
MESKNLIEEIRDLELRLSYADPKTAKKLTAKMVALKERLANLP